MARLLIYTLCSALALASCRSSKLPVTAYNANDLYANRHYYEAEKMFTKLLKKEDDEQLRKDYVRKVANCYRQMNKYALAEIWYARVVKENPTQPEYLFIYGNMLMSNEKYAEAQDVFKRYSREVPGDPRADARIKMSEKAESFSQSSTGYQISRLDNINTKFNEYAPVEVNNTLFFTSDRDESTGDEEFGWLGTYYADIFSAEKKDGEFEKPEPLGTSINSNKNEGVSSFNKAGDIMVFTQCNGAGFDSSCAVMIAERNRGKWNEPQVVPGTSNGKFIYGQACISDNGNSIVFVSDQPGGFGGHDLYIIRRKNKQSPWSEPENLGAKINSRGDEMFPYLYDDNTLYFSSNGHAGFGGLDIFKADNVNDRWRKPANLLPPMNSGSDDFGISFSKENAATLKGYFTSNRSVNGDDDLFAFQKVNPPLCTISGYVYNKASKEPMANATVYLTNIMEDKTVFVQTDSKGFYSMKLLYEQEYKLTAYKKFYSYNEDKPRVSTRNLTYQKRFEQDFYLEKWSIAEIEIEGILYDLDSYELREESENVLDSLSRLLKIHYYLTVELSSHTDCRGSKDYNQTLSQKRAESCVNYLIEQGIAEERLKPKGYGENKLLNNCACEDGEGPGRDCSEEEHQENRRTSFQIIRTDYEVTDDKRVGEPYEDPEEER